MKPVMTGRGDVGDETPKRKMPMTSNKIPDNTPAIQIPFKPYFCASKINTALIAPVVPKFDTAHRESADEHTGDDGGDHTRRGCRARRHTKSAVERKAGNGDPGEQVLSKFIKLYPVNSSLINVGNERRGIMTP